MTHNLRLPICPKCFDTKHVAESVTLAVKLGPHYCCTKCNVEWSGCPPRIKDEHGHVHTFNVNTKSDTLSDNLEGKLEIESEEIVAHPRMKAEDGSEIKWTYTLDKDLPTVYHIDPDRPLFDKLGRVHNFKVNTRE